MSNLATLLLIGAAGFGAASSLRLIEKSSRRRLLSCRTTLSDEEICGQISSDMAASSASIIAAYREVGRILKVDYRILRADDKLEDLVGLPKWLGSNGATGIDILIGDLENSLSAEQCPGNDISLTIGDVAKLFMSSQRSKA